MKKIKSLILFFVFLMIITLSCYSVNALSYTSYVAGDKITVSVNETEKIDFYVIKDSGSESDSVTAITYGFIDENVYNYPSAKHLADEKKTEWSNVDRVSLPTAQELLNVQVNLENEYSSQTFTEPTWVSPKTDEFTSYWLLDSAYNGSYASIKGMDTYYNSQFHLVPTEAVDEIYVKLLIEVDKKYVKNGVVMTPWERFVDYFTTEEFYFGDEISEDDIKITHDDKNLTVQIKDKEGKSYETKYSYENGILTYSKKGNLMYDDTYLNTRIYGYFIDTYGYTMEKFYNYIWLGYPSNDLTVEKDGIEITVKPYYTEEEEAKLQKELDKTLASLSEEERKSYEEDGLDKVFNPLVVTELKVDLVNGLKTYDESKIPFHNITFENKNYVIGKSDYFVIKVFTAYEQLESIYIDDKLVDKKHYDVILHNEIKPIITIKKEYLDKLSVGEHVIKVVFKDGEFAQDKFNIKMNNPKTGINLNYIFFCFVVLFGSIIYLVIRKQSKFPKHN